MLQLIANDQELYALPDNDANYSFMKFMKDDLSKRTDVELSWKNKEGAYAIIDGVFDYLEAHNIDTKAQSIDVSSIKDPDLQNAIANTIGYANTHGYVYEPPKQMEEQKMPEKTEPVKQDTITARAETTKTAQNLSPFRRLDEHDFKEGDLVKYAALRRRQNTWDAEMRKDPSLYLEAAMYMAEHVNSDGQAKVWGLSPENTLNYYFQNREQIQNDPLFGEIVGSEKHVAYRCHVNPKDYQNTYEVDTNGSAAGRTWDERVDLERRSEVSSFDRETGRSVTRDIPEYKTVSTFIDHASGGTLIQKYNRGGAVWINGVAVPSERVPAGTKPNTKSGKFATAKGWMDLTVCCDAAETRIPKNVIAKVVENEKAERAALARGGSGRAAVLESITGKPVTADNLLSQEADAAKRLEHFANQKFTFTPDRKDGMTPEYMELQKQTMAFELFHRYGFEKEAEQTIDKLGDAWDRYAETARFDKSQFYKKQMCTSLVNVNKEVSDVSKGIDERIADTRAKQKEAERPKAAGLMKAAFKRSAGREA